MSKDMVKSWGVVVLAAVIVCPLGHRLGASGQLGAGTGRQATSAGTETVVGGIAAAAEVQALLRKTREALGGHERLLGVRSLALESVLTVAKRPPRPSTQLVLLPDRFLERRGGNTFAIDGGEYWQQPEPANKQVAQQRTTRTFATQCLLFLLTAPGSVPLRATRSEATDSGVVALLFEGPEGFRHGVEIDATSFRLRAVTFPSVVESSAGTVRGTSRMVIEEYRRVDGIWFPARTTTRMEAAGVDIVVDYPSIRVNEGVQRADFVKK